MRALLWFLFGGALGAAAGAGGMLVAFPFLFPPPQVDETVSSMAAAAGALHRVTLRADAKGQDAAHWGRGSIKIYAAQDGNYLLELQDDFQVGPGPNFWLYLNTSAGIDDEKDFLADSGRMKIAKLKSFAGSQVYAVEAAAYEQAKALTIWCESFNQYIASADLITEQPQ